MKLTKLYQYLQYKETNLQYMLQKELMLMDYVVNTGTENKYVYGVPTKEDSIPVLLIAHTDTVHKLPPDDIFYDEKQKVMWSPDGLGADDRAGVFAVMEIARKMNVSVLFTTGEESGGKGARAFVKDYVNNQGYKMLIQLDRRGSNDCVFYSNSAKDFHDYIQDAGFVKTYGSFSDISIIAPAWRVNAVNLSVGYYREHSFSECLYVDQLQDTITKVRNLLSQPIQSFEYSAQVYQYPIYQTSAYWKNGKYQTDNWARNEIDDDYMQDSFVTPNAFTKDDEDHVVECSLCEAQIDERDSVWTDWDDDIDTFVCEDCFDKLDGYFCAECAEPVFPHDLKWLPAKELEICDRCFEETFLVDGEIKK